MSARDDAEARLRIAPWLTDPRTQRIFALLPGTRAVGGVVRDTILGRERDNAEIDFATELLPDDVIRRAKAAGVAAHPTGIDHGTVTLAIDGLVAEVTTLREDVETDGRRAVVKFGTDWPADAARRDFTLNALYADAKGALLDPLGGLGDALAGRVRFIGDPDRRIAEDRLRVFRFFRFSASHGGQHLDPKGLEAVTRAVNDLGNLSVERIGAEMLRMLALPRVAATLRVMWESGILAHLAWGKPPELGPKAEAFDTLARLEDLEPNPTREQRLALFDLLGMPATILKDKWRLSGAQVDAAWQVSWPAQFIAHNKWRFARYRYPNTAIEAVAVTGAIERWDRGKVEAVRAEIANTTVPPFPLTSEEIIAAMPPEAHPIARGETIDAIKELWAESGFTLGPEDLLAHVKRS